MATEKRRIVVEQEVEICDRCGSHVQPLAKLDLFLNGVPDEPLLEKNPPLRRGAYCTICTSVIANSFVKRKRKPKEA